MQRPVPSRSMTESKSAARSGAQVAGSPSGFLNVDKAAGATSMDVVRRIKRASQMKRVGHGGTLDPIATGVIPICIGQATRMMEYLVDSTKEYRGTIELGVETDTYDALGEVKARKDPSPVTAEDVELAIGSFHGVIEQVPPMYSALKRGGKRLYDLARAGIEVERKPRQVEVHSIELVRWETPEATVQLTCGRGFYVRSLAHDLGQQMGYGGHLKELTRLRSGPFRLSEAMTIDEAEQSFADESWRDRLYPPDVVVAKMRAAIVGSRLERRIRHGQSISEALRIPFSQPNEQCRVYSTDGRFIAILAFAASAGQWRPERVFDNR